MDTYPSHDPANAHRRVGVLRMPWALRWPQLTRVGVLYAPGDQWGDMGEAVTQSLDWLLAPLSPQVSPQVAQAAATWALVACGPDATLEQARLVLADVLVPVRSLRPPVSRNAATAGSSPVSIVRL